MPSINCISKFKNLTPQSKQVAKYTLYICAAPCSCATLYHPNISILGCHCRSEAPPFPTVFKNTIFFWGAVQKGQTTNLVCWPWSRKTVVFGGQDSALDNAAVQLLDGGRRVLCGHKCHHPVALG